MHCAYALCLFIVPSIVPMHCAYALCLCIVPSFVPSILEYGPECTQYEAPPVLAELPMAPAGELCGCTTGSA